MVERNSSARCQAWIKLNLYGHDFEPDTRQLLADIAADTGSTILFDDGY